MSAEPKDGWLPWQATNPCPVPGDTIVEVKLGSGSCGFGPQRADRYRWTPSMWMRPGDDIVAYRVVHPEGESPRVIIFRSDTSFPFLKIARENDVNYGDVLRAADALSESTDPHNALIISPLPNIVLRQIRIAVGTENYRRYGLGRPI